MSLRLRALLGLVMTLASGPVRAEVIGPDGFCGVPARIDFETGGPQFPLVPGVRFLFESVPGASNWLAGVPTRVGGGFLAGPPFGSQAYGNLVASTTPLSWSGMAIQFTPPQAAVGAYVGSIPNFLDTATTVVTVQARDAAGLLLDETTVGVPALGEPPWFVGFAEVGPISRLEWRPGNPGFLGVDEIRYGLASSACSPTLEIPTVSTASLVLLALALVAVALRRM